MVALTARGAEFSELLVEVFRVNGLLLAAPAGLTSARWQVLGVVDHGPCTVAQVARNMGLIRQTVRQTAAGLVRDGMVEFRDNPADRRARLLAPTPRGAAAGRARASGVGQRDRRARSADRPARRLRRPARPRRPAGGMTAVIPSLPCPSIDEVPEFYSAQGFERTHRQSKPNPYRGLLRTPSWPSPRSGPLGIVPSPVARRRRSGPTRTSPAVESDCEPSSAPGEGFESTEDARSSATPSAPGRPVRPRGRVLPDELGEGAGRTAGQVEHRCADPVLPACPDVALHGGERGGIPAAR